MTELLNEVAERLKLSDTSCPHTQRFGVMQKKWYFPTRNHTMETQFKKLQMQ
jgi:hypothetical protein